MVVTVVIVSVFVLATMLLVLLKPNVKLKHFTLGVYWVAALVGAIVLLASGLVDARSVGERLIAADGINPIKILVFFLSMTMLSVFLDELGFFRYLAGVTLKKADDSQKKLFVYLYVLVSVLTVFTSNDIIILTFTPFICFFAKNAKINPFPYLFCEFVAANTWSMLFVIGNPTNIYLATSSGSGFVDYLKVMALPTLFGGIASFVVLYLLFRKQLSKPLSHDVDDAVIEDKTLLFIGVAHLVACTVLLVISSYINLETWIISLCFAGSLFVIAMLYRLAKRKKPKEVLACLKRAPWELVPFVLSMFVFVLAFAEYGITEKIAAVFRGEAVIWEYGGASFLTANVINNIPMSVLFGEITSALSDEVKLKAVYATVIGSNVGAFFTPLGALAGIMWSGILRAHDVDISFGKFVKYGAVISLSVLAASLAGLQVVFAIS